MFCWKNTLTVLLDECKCIRKLKQIHCQIITSLPRNVSIFGRLIFRAASNDGSFEYAFDVFRQIETRNLFMYNVIIRALGCKTRSEFYLRQALVVYKQMLADGIRPNNLTFPFLLKSLWRLRDPYMGKVIHSQTVKFGFCNDLFVQNAMIPVYCVYGCMSYARQLFDEMTTTDTVSWNSIIMGYLRCGDLVSAVKLFHRMKEKNLITWNSIITGFVQAGNPREALQFFHDMQVLLDEGIQPNKITVASVISACASLGALDQGKWIHAYLKRRKLEFDVVIGTALIDMYGKCGCMEKAFEVFRSMPCKDVTSWTAMISVFSNNGLGKEALHLFSEMEMHGIKPNHITFVGLLCACAHAGLVEEGRNCFEKMQRVYHIHPEVHHYACMVDLLGRARFFREAEELIRTMPMNPDVYVWGALLGACRMHGNVELGERIALHLIELEPLNHAFYIALSDIYAVANRFEEVKKVRNFMKERGIKKDVPGCSMIEVDGIIHEFSVSRPSVSVKEIKSVLTGICCVLKFADSEIDIDQECL